jgi:MoaA/NifB/PqqE/SkfB family radical SAM enzyme
MRTEPVFTNHRCNQSCTYCTFRRSEDDLVAIQPKALREAIDLAIRDGAEEVVLTGGEPTMRRDLPDLVQHVVDQGARAVLQTNATLIDLALATRLREAGLGKAVVNLAGTSQALDAVTRDPGGFDRALLGIEALVAANIPFEIEASVVRSTLPFLSSLPARAKELGALALVLNVPTESPDPSELLTWEESTRAVKAIVVAARSHGLSVRFAPDAAPPPCAFPKGSRVEHLYGSLAGLIGAAPSVEGDEPGGRRQGYCHVEACRDCLVSGGCTGIAEAYLARHPHTDIHPITEDRVRRRLSLVSTVADQVARELVSTSIGLVIESVIRVQFHCNQSCTFCFVSTHLAAPPDAMVQAAIEEAGRRESKIVLSGGEPTLHPRLTEWVHLAKSVSKLPVQIQTNAVRLEDAGLVAHLAEAGLDEAFVSLHGATAEISDRVTEAPGTFVRTLVGIDHLAKSSIRVIVNFVLCETNYREAPAFVELVATRWPNAVVNFSFIAPSSDLVPRTRELIPRYSDVLPHLDRAIAIANRAGLSVVGLESMCGLPLCLVPSRVHDLAPLEIPKGFDGGEFVKGLACQTCARETRCYGLRRGYEAMYGDTELRGFAS